jgi:hypothetical protein
MLLDCWFVNVISDFRQTIKLTNYQTGKHLFFGTVFALTLVD